MPLKPASPAELRDLAQFVKKLAGINLSENKNFLIENRLFRHLEDLNVSTYTDYLNILKENSEEQKRCVEYLTTHMTEWFREKDHFVFLRSQLPQMLKKNQTLYFWSAACSTGQEVYSLLFLLLREGLKPHQFKILGTDISRPVLEKAVSLPDSESFHEQIANYFGPGFEHSPKMADLEIALEKCIKFREYNLIEDSLQANIKFDMIFLRNVLIYFDSPTVEKVCRQINRFLKPQGHLILGLSESLHNQIPEYHAIGKSIYEYLPAGAKTTDSPARAPGNRLQDIKNRVLIVEDSMPIQKILVRAYSQIENIEVVGCAANVDEACKLMASEKPNFISLDMKLAGGTGIDFLQKSQFKHYASKNSARCVLITDCTQSEGNLVFEAMELGASMYLQKPQANNISEFTQNLTEIVTTLFRNNEGQNFTGESNQPSTTPLHFDLKKYQLIAIGSSTGGTEVVRKLIDGFPADAPPILVVQHMPEQFTGLFASRLSSQTGKKVLEVNKSMPIYSGEAYIAQGGKHLVLDNKKGQLHVKTTETDPVNKFRPSVSVMFDSITDSGLAAETLAIILTGMGNDGAKAMLKLKQNGALTLGQSKESCVVYGMPRAAQELGALQWSGTPNEMITLLNKTSGGLRRAG